MSRQILLPYGRESVAFRLEPQMQLLQPRAWTYESSEDELLEAALANPHGGKRLCELAVGKKTAVIISSDHTRPVPTKKILPLLLRELYAGNPEIEITVLIATGCHRSSTPKELEQKFGRELLTQVHVVQHNCDDMDAMRDLGPLPSGGRLLVNQLAVEADLLLAEGFIEPHFFAGFSGGRKSILPGVAARESVLYNHNAQLIASPYAKAGELEHNPIHQDMLFAAKKAGLAFICNVVLDANKRIVEVHAGDPEAAHLAGCLGLKQRLGVYGHRTSIVITTNSGYPMDQNIYQCVKGLSTACEVCQPGGVIIQLAQCEDGHGGKAFYQRMKEAKDPQSLADSIAKIPPDKTTPDQWQYQILARILCHCHVILVTQKHLENMVREMHMGYAGSLQEGLKQARTIAGSDAQISVIPDGVGTMAFCN